MICFHVVGLNKRTLPVCVHGGIFRSYQLSWNPRGTTHGISKGSQCLLLITTGF